MPTSTTAPPIRRKKVFQKTRVAESRLRANLQKGLYRPGHLNKTYIAAQLNINDQTLNPIFEKLAKEGILEKKGHGKRNTYYVPEPKSVPAGLVAEAQASVALDGETQSYDSEVPMTRAEVAAAKLRAQLTAGKYPVGSPLPTQDALVAELGASRNVIWRAINSLKEEGLLEGGSGRRSARIIALPAQESKPDPTTTDEEVPEPSLAVPLSKRQTVTDYLKNAILSGEFPPYSTLPSREVLRSKLGVSAGTVDYVLARLEGLGYIVCRPGGSLVLPESERGSTHTEPVEQHPTPPDTVEQDALIPANEVMPIIKVLYDENRRLMKVEAEANKSNKKIADLEAQLRTSAFEMADLRGKFHDVDAQNAELRLATHRNGSDKKVIRSFGPEFKHSLGMSDTEADRIKGLIETKRVMEEAPGFGRER
jgi:DNA-binding GntR family transcriptional regulator/predicted transcriptional regulator